MSAKLTSQRRISPHEGQEGGSIGPASAAASFGWRNGCASPGEGVDSCRQRSQIGNPGPEGRNWAPRSWYLSESNLASLRNASQKPTRAACQLAKPSTLSRVKFRYTGVAHSKSHLKSLPPECPHLIATVAGPLFSPRGETKCVKRPPVRGARPRGGVLEQYGEHGNQTQRSNGGLIACFSRQVLKRAG